MKAKTAGSLRTPLTFGYIVLQMSLFVSIVHADCMNDGSFKCLCDHINTIADFYVRMDFCEQNTFAKTVCPVSCNICGCEDNTDFIVQGTPVCELVASQTPAIIVQACTTAAPAYENCPVTCNDCDTISTNKATYTAGEEIAVKIKMRHEFDGSPWIGIYPESEGDSGLPASYLTWDGACESEDIVDGVCDDLELFNATSLGWPLCNGEYKVHLFEGYKSYPPYDPMISSDIFTVSGGADCETNFFIETDKTLYSPGENITVTFSTDEGGLEGEQSFIAIYKADADPANGIDGEEYLAYEYVCEGNDKGFCAGTVVFQPNDPDSPICNGDYKVWFINGDGDPSYYTDVLSSDVFTVEGYDCEQASIVVPSSSYSAGQDIIVEVYDLPYEVGGYDYWIGIYPSDEDPNAPLGSMYVMWTEEFCSSSVVVDGICNDAVVFNDNNPYGGWPICNGEYRAHLLFGNSNPPYNAFLSSNTFTVSGGNDCETDFFLETDKETYGAGENITVSYSTDQGGLEPNHSFIAIYPVDADPAGASGSDYLVYEYVCEGNEKGFCAGSVVFDPDSDNWEYPLCDGEYKAWFLNEGDYYTVVLSSEVFTVTGIGCN